MKLSPESITAKIDNVIFWPHLPIPPTPTLRCHLECMLQGRCKQYNWCFISSPYIIVKCSKLATGK